MVSRKSPLMRPLAKKATRPSCSKPSSRSAAVAVSMLPEMRVVGRRAFGDAHQDPVARRRLQPHLEFVALPLVEAHANHGVARVRGRLQFDHRKAAVLDFDLRLARSVGENLVLARDARLPTMERYGESTLKAAMRAGARGLAVLVEHAQRDDRAGATVGHQLRGGLVDLGAHRAATEVHRALAAPGFAAVLLEHARRRAGSRHRRDRPRASGSWPPCSAEFTLTPSNDSGSDGLAVHRELHGLAGPMLDGDLGHRNRRRGIRQRRQPADSRA